ncbi:MAG: hypothetical protein RBS80_28765, partial [Thermoguttaceae bacterium]|nr:hypothetical protein [Thermoguttaceae bacterium]
MKRIMLRIGALGTVVALGLIAIAQAQRGHSLDADTASNAATDESPDSDDGRPIPGAQQASQKNPLREDSPEAAAKARGNDRPFLEPPLTGRIPNGAPPTELSESRPADPFARPPGDFVVPAAGDVPNGNPALLASHAEQPAQAPPGMQLADASGQSLRPYPSSEGDRFPALRPPEEDANPSAEPGPRLGAALSEDPPARAPTDPPARQPEPAQLPPIDPLPATPPDGRLVSDEGTARGAGSP